MKEELEATPPKGVSVGTETIEGKLYTNLACKAQGVRITGRFENAPADGERMLVLTVDADSGVSPATVKELLEELLFTASDDFHVRTVRADAEETLSRLQQAFNSADNAVDFSAGFAALEGKKEAVVSLKDLLAPLQEQPKRAA